MVLKKSIRQNLALKNIDILDAVLGNDGLLYSRHDQGGVTAPILATEQEETRPVRNAFVVLEQTQAQTVSSSLTEEKSTGEAKVTKKLSKKTSKKTKE